MLEHRATFDQLAIARVERIVRGELEIAPVADRALLLLQWERDAVLESALKRAAGLALPGPGTAAWHDGGAIMWLAPRERLLDLPARRARDAHAELACATASGELAAVTDLSDAFCCVRLAGSMARELLAAGCSIDFAAEAFGAGRTVRTRVADVPAIVTRCPDADAWLCYVDRSLAAAFWRWLATSCETVCASASTGACRAPPAASR